MTRAAWGKVAAVAWGQHGLVTLRQFERCGVSRQVLLPRLQSREIERILPGVFRLRSSRSSWDQRALAALLWLGPDAALSGASAAYLFGVDGFQRPGRVIEVVVPRSTTNGANDRQNADYVLRRCRKPVETQVVAGLRVTSLAQAVVDLAGTLTENALDDALDSAQRMYPGVDTEIDWILGARGRGRVGSVLLKRLLDERGGLSTDSPLEARVFRHLRRSLLPRPRHQLPLRDLDGHVRWIDFAWPQHRVALHVDGYKWHHQRRRFEHDREALNRLAALGWHSLFVTKRSLDDGSWFRPLETVLAAREPQLRLL